MQEKRSVAGINHLAIKTNALEALSQFYIDTLGLLAVKHHHDDKGLRAIWLEMQNSLLMLERSDQHKNTSSQAKAEFKNDPPGIHLLAFNIEESEKEWWRSHLHAQEIVIAHESQYTIYFFDPDGNRIGLSSFEPPVLTS